MPIESIFHKIVSNEDSHTQLLCNTLKREPTLLHDLLDKVGLKATNLVKPEEMRTQVPLNGCGKADLRIQTDKFTVIFEIKIEPGRKLEESQKLNGSCRGYKDWLEGKKRHGCDAWLVYLVPGSWEYRSENEKAIKEYEELAGQQAISVCQIYWHDVLQLLQKNDPPKSSPIIIEQFRLLLMERLGPINFTLEEIKSMFNPDFPMKEIIKLNTVLEGLKRRAGKEAKTESVSYEFGFYLTKDERKLLFVGLSWEFWNARHYYPICFGVRDEDVRVKAAFSEAFRNEYRKEPIPVAAMEWTMGGVPREDFDRFETADAIDEIWAKLEPIWHRVKQVR